MSIEPMAEEEFDAIADRLRQSTGPHWKVCNDWDGEDWFVAQLGASGEDGLCYFVVTDGVRASELTGDAAGDAHFIANAPKDVKTLLLEVLRLQEEVKLANEACRDATQLLFEERTISREQHETIESLIMERDSVIDILANHEKVRV